MTAWSDFAENKLIDWFFRAQAIGITGATAAAGTGPANLYVALLTAAPSDTGGGTEISTSGTNYGRQTVVSGLTTWNGTHGNTTGASSGTNGTTSNANVITYGAPSSSWGSITHAAVYDAVTGGNLIAWGALTTPKTVNNGDPAPTFAAGALTFQIDT